MEKTNHLKEGEKSKAVQQLPYLLFGLPLILAYISWHWFPFLVDYVVGYFFRCTPKLQTAHWLWRATVYFLYTWYTFLAIGVGGTFVVAAWLWKRKKIPEKKMDYPMVSFVTPAYNEEKQILRCIASLFKCATQYPGPCEIIVIDDGSEDHTYEVAWATVETNRGRYPHVYGKVVRHSANLGKAEAIRTGVNKAMGSVVAVVDADSWWEPGALTELINYMNSNGKVAATGYIHPSNGGKESNPYVILQQLEYSQGLGIFRCAQALGNAVLVIPGPIGVYRADILRKILNKKKMHTVTEDLEITLEMQKEKLSVGYVVRARGSTLAPTSFRDFWAQRIRWFIGWLHNILEVHRELLYSRQWIASLLWYYLFLGYIGAVVEIIATFSVPFLFWFSPDRTCFLINLLIFVPYALLVGIINQAIALKFSYDQFNYRRLLLYTPLYGVLRLINVCARFACLVKFFIGERGSWRETRRRH